MSLGRRVNTSLCQLPTAAKKAGQGALQSLRCIRSHLLGAAAPPRAAAPPCHYLPPLPTQRTSSRKPPSRSAATTAPATVPLICTARCRNWGVTACGAILISAAGVPAFLRGGPASSTRAGLHETGAASQ